MARAVTMSSPAFSKMFGVGQLHAINGNATAIWTLAREGDPARKIMFGQQYETCGVLSAT